jgi:hypothetical protein
MQTIWRVIGSMETSSTEKRTTCLDMINDLHLLCLRLTEALDKYTVFHAQAKLRGNAQNLAPCPKLPLKCEFPQN